MGGLSKMSLAETLNSLEGWFDRAGRTTLLDALRSDIEVLPGFYFLSLADALSVRAENLTSGAWDPNWLPLLTDGAGYHFAVDLNGESDPPVRRCEFDEVDHPVAFMSIADMISTIEQGYARGVFTVDGRGYLSMDQGEFEALGAEMNPEADAWQPLES